MKCTVCDIERRPDEPHPPMLCAAVLRGEVDLLRGSVGRIKAALADVFKLMDDGFLVRDTSRDHEPDWAIRMLEPVHKLKMAHETLQSFCGIFYRKE